MPDGDRLRLLKEVVRTTIYDEKKEESLRKMDENHSNVNSIRGSLVYMEERLKTLRGEKEELSQYLTLDKKRRSMVFILYDKEVRGA